MEVIYEQMNPHALLRREEYPTLEKAMYWGEKWIEQQKDSYDPRTGAHPGPDFFYTIWL